jgi:A/G-specific adenine glycosylase
VNRVPAVGDAPAAGRRGRSRTAALLAWGEGHLRDLPWRATRDPWAVLVSEVMAQQTGVDRVVPYWHAFLARFPTPGDCAAAPVGEVVRLWSGLGYNRRAVNLHGCARAVVERHAGTLPDRLDHLLALPGVGPYTARAVLAFAYERPVGVVDTNVGRVLARWAGRALRPAEAQSLADALAVAAGRAAAGGDDAAGGRGPGPVVAVGTDLSGDRAAGEVPEDGSSGRAWVWNQAVMELGGTVCRRRRPNCRACPVQRWCGWAAAGLTPPDPADGSAGVSTGQPRFAGSDRQGRGRLVEALCRGPVRAADAAGVMGWPEDPARADRVVVGMVADGLAELDGDTLRLP